MKLKHILLLLALLPCIMNCEGILEEHPKSFFEEGNSFLTADDATSAVNEVYSRHRSVYGMTMINLADVNGEELEVYPYSAQACEIDLNRYTSGSPVFDSFYTN